VFEDHHSTSKTTLASYDVTALATSRLRCHSVSDVTALLKKHQMLAEPMLQSGVITHSNRVYYLFFINFINIKKAFKKLYMF